MPGQPDFDINSDTGPRTTYDQLLDVIMPALAATSHRLPCVSGTQAERMAETPTHGIDRKYLFR